MFSSVLLPAYRRWSRRQHRRAALFKTMDTEIEEVKQKIRKVQDQIDRVEELLTQAAAKEDDVAYLRKKEEQLREEKLVLLKKEEQLREEKLVLLKAGTSAGGMEVGGENPLFKFVQLEGGHPMSKFVACLKKKTLQERIRSATANSVIELPEGTVWLGDRSTFSNQLFLRPCYFELLEAKEEYFKMKPDYQAVVYTGTPGIGKSHLCALVVAQKLIDGTVVFFEHWSTSDGDTAERRFYRLDLRNGVHSCTSSQVLDFVSSEENAVYIVDGGFPSFDSAQVETQIFASPSKPIFRPQKKHWPYLYLYTPLFDLEEICKCKSVISAFQKISQEDVGEWFSAAGGVARTVLKGPSEGDLLKDWKVKATQDIAATDEKAVESMIAGLQRDTFARGSDALFHWRVEEKYLPRKGCSPEKSSLRRFKRKILCFASDWVANQFYLKFQLEKILRVASFILNSSVDVELSALRGYWFETLSHMILSSGGSFDCRWLDTCEEFKLTLPESKDYTFKSDADAALACQVDLSVYCKPMARNYPAIDSLSSPYLFFQMASGTSHRINKNGLHKIIKAMRKGGRFTLEAENFVKGACVPARTSLTGPVFVFCTTPENFQSRYKSLQSFIQDGLVVSNVEAIQQAVLEIPIDFRIKGDAVQMIAK